MQSHDQESHWLRMIAGALFVVAVLSIGSCAKRGTEHKGSDGSGTTKTPTAVEPVSYDRDVRPILTDKCFKCHGGDGATREAGLRLDDPQGATAVRPDGLHAISPFHPEASEVMARVTSKDPTQRMPPLSSNKPPLSKAEQSILSRWIAEGARYEPHWSFVPPKAAMLPKVENKSWPRSTIDHFVLANLEAKGQTPNPDAEPEVLLRRLFLQLTGLPPTPEEQREFQETGGLKSYESWVDRLLNQEPYRTRHAERLAIPWLDAARFADTCGIHTDAGRQIWPWRDWVLKALRDNMPFDRFVIEQLAGDLLPDATRDQKVASGFHRNHVTTDEGGAIAEEYLVEYAVDRVATTGSVFFGLTFGCARCHDHKYDPVSQEEFYRLFAFFNSIEEPGLYSQLSNAERAFEPYLQVPSEEQERLRERLRGEKEALLRERERDNGGEDAERATFVNRLRHDGGLESWLAKIVGAKSTNGATLEVQADGSLLASGKNPDTDTHIITLSNLAPETRMIFVQAMTDPSLAGGRVGRAENGNAVLTGIEISLVPNGDFERETAVPLAWAFADHEQPNGDFRIVNALTKGDRRGWAANGHGLEGGRFLAFLLDSPIQGDSNQLVVRIEYQSQHNRHVLGRLKFFTAKLQESLVSRLPVAKSDWYRLGPFASDTGQDPYATDLGPEGEQRVDFARRYGKPERSFRHELGFLDGKVNALDGGTNVSYVARSLFSSTAREVLVSLGSDDGIKVFLNGAQVFERKIDRGAAPDQEKIKLKLEKGQNHLLLKIINTGGEAAFYQRLLSEIEQLDGDLVLELAPEESLDDQQRARRRHAWRQAFSPKYTELTASIALKEEEEKKLEAAIPLTMVMKELETPRETFVLTRGQYDLQDKSRRVLPGVPAVLGALDEDQPKNRLGLARWLASEKNPLFARVTTNRIFEMIFGVGIVRTPEDFGMQGEWPTHPELLDTLSLEFQRSGYDVRALIRSLVASRTFQQSARQRTELSAVDPENRWLSSFPRKRLPAEFLRDQALFAAGLLNEHFGGPSVKPYQPEGLWEEVSMPASNTRSFRRDSAPQIWRRSLYTYWKRASPPPSLMTLDAPTREFCTIRRAGTSTPLQSLVLWNDEQFVEATRVLAERVLTDGSIGEDDSLRIKNMAQRLLGRSPSPTESTVLLQALQQFRSRFQKAPADAAKLAAIGQAPRKAELSPIEVAAFTLLASTLMNLDASLTLG